MKSCPECYSEYEDSLDLTHCPKDQTPLKSPELDPLVGTRLGDRYEIVSVIGRGGMGVVYKARQEQMDKLMAIKMLHSHMVSDSEAVKRFYREAKTVSQVKHHHIVTLFDFGIDPLFNSSNAGRIDSPERPNPHRIEGEGCSSFKTVFIFL